MLFVGEGGFDGFRHFELAGAEFVVGMPFRQQALAAEELADGHCFGGGGHLSYDFSRREQVGSQPLTAGDSLLWSEVPDG